MIVSRKNIWNAWNSWLNLKSECTRLSGPYYRKDHTVNSLWHKLYGRNFNTYWHINDKAFEKFKEV